MKTCFGNWLFEQCYFICKFLLWVQILADLKKLPESWDHLFRKIVQLKNLKIDFLRAKGCFQTWYSWKLLSGMQSCNLTETCNSWAEKTYWMPRIYLLNLFVERTSVQPMEFVFQEKILSKNACMNIVIWMPRPQRRCHWSLLESHRKATDGHGSYLCGN